MAIMLSDLHEALLAAGVPDEKARKAAEEVAQYRDDIADIKSTLRLHTWMLSVLSATMIVVGLPAVWLLVKVAAKVGALS